jgi:hypothetical protein
MGLEGSLGIQKKEGLPLRREPFHMLRSEDRAGCAPQGLSSATGRSGALAGALTSPDRSQAACDRSPHGVQVSSRVSGEEVAPFWLRRSRHAVQRLPGVPHLSARLPQ